MTLPVSAVRDLLCWQCSQPLASPLFILWKQNNDSSIIHGQKGIQLEATSVAATMGGWSWAEWKLKYSFCFKKTRNTLQRVYLIFWVKILRAAVDKMNQSRRLLEKKLNTLQSPSFSSPFFSEGRAIGGLKEKGSGIEPAKSLYIFKIDFIKII